MNENTYDLDSSLKESYLKLVKLSSLFKDFQAGELHKFFNSKNSKIQVYKPDSVIFFEDEKCLYMNIILKGSVFIQKIDKDGNVLTITEFASGENLGSNLLFSENPYYPMTVTSKDEVVLFSISKEVILEMCNENKTFLIEFLKSVSDKAAILTNKIKTISMKTIRDIITDFLVYEYAIQGTTKIKLPTSKKELAEKFGIQRTSLSRELAKMRKDGLITYDANFVKIEDTSLINI